MPRNGSSRYSSRKSRRGKRRSTLNPGIKKVIRKVAKKVEKDLHTENNPKQIVFIQASWNQNIAATTANTWNHYYADAYTAIGIGAAAAGGGDLVSAVTNVAAADVVNDSTIRTVDPLNLRVNIDAQIKFILYNQGNSRISLQIYECRTKKLDANVTTILTDSYAAYTTASATAAGVPLIDSEVWDLKDQHELRKLLNVKLVKHVVMDVGSEMTFVGHIKPIRNKEVDVIQRASYGFATMYLFRYRGQLSNTHGTQSAIGFAPMWLGAYVEKKYTTRIVDNPINPYTNWSNAVACVTNIGTVDVGDEVASTAAAAN